MVTIMPSANSTRRPACPDEVVRDVGGVAAAGEGPVAPDVDWRMPSNPCRSPGTPVFAPVRSPRYATRRDIATGASGRLATRPSTRASRLQRYRAGMAMVALHRRLPTAVSAGAVLLMATAVWWQAAPPAHADGATVAVQMTEDGPRYAPAEVTIALGETVTWVWETDGHSVTHDPGEGQQRVFDSHPSDPEAPIGCPPFCGEQGDTFAFSEFPEPGEYAYVSKMDPDPERTMRGVVVVTEPPAQEASSTSPTPATPSPTQDPDPSPTATSEPERSPEDPSTSEPAPEPEPEAEPAPEPEPEPAPPPPQPDPQPEQRVAAPQSVDRESASETPTAGAPTVASGDASPSPVPEPTFEDFPDATDPTDDGDVPGEVALGGSDDQRGTGRTVWALLGGASVLGTLGVFGRTVLFSDAWNA